MSFNTASNRPNRRLNLIRQPAGSTLCGQCCVATLADVSIDAAIGAFNSFGKTRTKHVREALKKFNISTPPRRTRHYTAWDNLPKDKTAILHVTNGKDRHWIIWFKNKFYDPAAGTFRKPPQYLIEQNSVPTSYLEIEFAQ